MVPGKSKGQRKPSRRVLIVCTFSPIHVNPIDNSRVALRSDLYLSLPAP